MRNFNMNQTNDPTASIRQLEMYCNTGAIYVMMESYYQWLGSTLMPFIATITTFLANIF